MKKFILFLILTQCNFLFSQTVLATFPLELKKSKEYKQIVNAENTATHDVFVFASDKETLTILKYNSALFLTNQYSLARPEITYKVLAGYSFNDEGNPTLYWSTPDFTKILAVQYDLNTKATVAVFNYDLPFFNQTIITQFQENNTFYILSQKHFEQKLILYVFKNGKKEEKTLDFGSFNFKNSKNKAITFSQILEVCPIEKIETNQFNPLFKGTQKTKLYVLKNKLLLTFDHNDNETQAFEIDLATFEILEKNISKTTTKNYVSLSNSYYHESKIYQLKVNEEELLFEIKDYKSGEIIKSIPVSKTETIPFKSSPLWLQLAGDRPKELKSTAKFLDQLVYLEVGITVYKTPKSILITLGGTGDIQFTDVGQDNTNLAFRNVPTTIYFESTFDKKLDHTKQEQEPLAVDFISRFREEHPEVTTPSIIRYKNYYIMGYYDTYAKQYTMRKFIDGFESSF
ncbi:hypothetical protein C8C85_1545 [Flavobacterium sp. 103]|uniref:hypothetical protein n=1 Tax=Flavobacterium sp. 103 TaxID=2135624 RepID=UPI000D5F8C93|nr:hypothetical protein [Flavobacterium sp. 103]PVX45740.1 hypothetical protein C8C85_1545 [Flavobacterium sp. 103]